MDKTTQLPQQSAASSSAAATSTFLAPPQQQQQQQQQPRRMPLTASSRSSIKRDSLASDVLCEGWVASSTIRDVTCLKFTFWRLNRTAVSVFANPEPKTPPTTIIPLEQIVNIEEAGADSPFVFVIRAVGSVLYVGSRQPLTNAPVWGPATSQYEYYCGWMTQMRQVWIPPPEEFNIRDQYEIHMNEILGQGQYGIVYTATHKPTGERVALKSIDYAQTSIKVISPETRIPKVLNHPNVIRIIGLYYTKEKIYIATEMLHGDLLNFILSQPNRRLDERVTKFVSYQIISAIAFLNHYDVVHCDIKPENVLLVSNSPFPQIKLCDFGYSRILNKGSVRRGSFVGTMNYLPPEAICRSPQFNSSLDTWACGVIVYVSLSGVFPYNPAEDIKAQILDDDIFFAPHAWREVSLTAKDIVRKLMELSARKRGDCARFKRHAWFTNDYQFWCDLKAFEEKRVPQDSRRWWSDDVNIDEAMEAMRVKEKLAHWSQIGCVIAPPSNSMDTK